MIYVASTNISFATDSQISINTYLTGRTADLHYALPLDPYPIYTHV